VVRRAEIRVQRRVYGRLCSTMWTLRGHHSHVNLTLGVASIIPNSREVVVDALEALRRHVAWNPAQLIDNTITTIIRLGCGGRWSCLGR
jgi:hypothetical protein